MKKPELLVPAGNLSILKTAIRYGADAVYIGGEAFSLRAAAKNATISELAEGIEYAHAFGKKVYITANIFAHNRDLEEAKVYFRELSEIRPDGVIISDPGMIRLAKKEMPEIPLHLSTQANNCNIETYLFWYEQGIKRIVAARELSLSELKEIRENTPEDLEIEAFVHGAMCISYSGRCLLSSFLTGRDSNQGACTHPCRWKYALVEEKRPGEYMPIEENDRGTYIMHSKDLCMIDHIDDLCASGIASLKIEGRMKTALYVATVTRAYRMAIDDYFNDPSLYEKNKARYLDEVSFSTHRIFTTGFYYGRSLDTVDYIGDKIEQGAVYLGTIEKIENGQAIFLQRNKFEVGETITILKPDGSDVKTKVLSIENEDHEKLDAASHASMMLTVSFSVLPEVGDVLRKETEEKE